MMTLGCRVNHAEARELESVLLDRGLLKARSGQRADLEVIHTCSVTHTAAVKSRHAIRRALRRQAEAQTDTRLPHNRLHEPDSLHAALAPGIIVTGCYGSTDTEQAIRLAGGPDRVIRHHADDGSALPDRFARRLDQWLGRHSAPDSLRRPQSGSFPQMLRPLPVVEPRAAGNHVRAELKIQDGCDAHCTFCTIPGIRRTLRSKSVGEAVGEARRLVDLGHREIVLTGIFIGAYGHETTLRHRQAGCGPQTLADLVDAVAQVRGLDRLRISSLEPGDAAGALLEAMVANRPVVAEHLHLPLQSGSDAVLKRMNRQYRVGDYLEMIDQVTEALTTPDGLPPAITTDIICGFPGETPLDFEKTVDVSRRVGYLHMHVFPFSPRRGTAAARWQRRFVEAETAKARVRRLIELEDEPDNGLSIRYRRRLLGHTARVIIEQADKKDPALVTGRCGHYAQVWLRTEQSRGAVVDVRITEVTPRRTFGEVIPAAV
jgi:threonylcarbamoyladenosine tRNA methylthiotransferase MtaB